MNEEARDYVRQQLKTGKSHDDIWREVISLGYGSDGFEKTYLELVKELGIEDMRLDIAKGKADSALADSLVKEDTNLPGPMELLLKSLTGSFHNILTTIITALVIMVPGLLLFILPTEPTLALSGLAFSLTWLAVILFIIINTLTSLTSLFYVVVNDDSELGFIHGLQWSMQNIFSIIWLGLVLLTVISVSSLLFIIPGLILAAYSVFSFVVLANGGQKGFSAIIRSIDLMSGNFWSIVYRLLTVKLLLILIVLFPLLIAWLVFMATSSGILIPAIASLFMVLIMSWFVATLTTAINILYKVQNLNKKLFDRSLYRGLKALLVFIFILPFLIAIGLLVYVNGGIEF